MVLLAPLIALPGTAPIAVDAAERQGNAADRAAAVPMCRAATPP